jgi:hypothetical protein
MIKVFITVAQGKKTDEIIESIINEKFALELALDEISLFEPNDNGKIVSVRQSQITFITKALLYSELEDFLFKNWKDSITTFYSLPILSMDKERANLVRKGLRTA